MFVAMFGMNFSRLILDKSGFTKALAPSPNGLFFQGYNILKRCRIRKIGKKGKDGKCSCTGMWYLIFSFVRAHWSCQRHSLVVPGKLYPAKPIQKSVLGLFAKNKNLIKKVF